MSEVKDSDSQQTATSTQDMWRMTLSQLQLDLSAMAFKTWFVHSNLIDIDHSEKIARVGLKNAYIKDYVETHFRNIVKRALTKTTGIDDVEPIFEISQDQPNDVDVADYDDPIFSSNSNQQANFTDRSTPQSIDSVVEEIATSSVQQQQNREELMISSGLNQRYKFENFVVGSGNRLAHAASIAVSENPGATYNPLFIHGGVGIGKTHLLQAIGNEIIWNRPTARVLYTPGESFLNELIQAIQRNKTIEFRERYRNIDVLIIDDLQVISGKTSTQEELFHTYNSLYQANKQIIFAADRPPSKIKQLTDRLRSRFEGGMVADMQMPDFETCVAILKRKSEEKNLFLTDNHLKLIADMAGTNVRELEGTLTKVGTFYYLSGKNLSDEEVKQIIQKDVEKRKSRLDPKEMIRIVAREFNVTVADIKGERRTNHIAEARQVSMYFLRRELGLPLEQVAAHLNRKDHTTVMHALERVDEKKDTSEEFAQKVDAVKKKLVA